MPFCHQSIFVKTDLQRSNEFDQNYNMPQILRLYLEAIARELFSYVERTISRIRYGGASNQNQEAVLWNTI